MNAAKSQPIELSEILTIGQVAKRAGWSRKRMWAHLVALDKELNGMLLVNISRGKKRPTWTISLSSLRFVHSAWFKDPEALDEMRSELTRVVEENAELKLRVAHLERTQRNQQGQIAALRPTG